MYWMLLLEKGLPSIEVTEAGIIAASAEMPEKTKADKAGAKQKDKEEAEAAAKKAEEDKAKLLEAFQASGKSVEELVAFLKGE